MALIPLNIPLTTTWLDITTLILANFEAETGIEFYLPYEHTKTLEILIDTSGAAIIDSSNNDTGTKLDRYFINTSTRLNAEYKYYARALDTIATLSIKDKGNAVSIEKVDIFKGALPIYDADVYNVSFNEFFHEHTDVNTTLAIASVSGDISITVVNAAVFTVGDNIQIENNIIEPTFPTIITIVDDVLTLDRQLDFNFDIGTTIEVVNFEMSVSGTIGNPISFKLIPDKNQQWYVVSLTISMIHSSTGDDSLFGDISPLLNGITFRGYNGLTDQYRTNSNWKTNGDFALDFGNLEYTDKAGGGFHATKAQVSLKVRSGAVPLLSGVNGDYLEFLVQDNLLALESVRVKAQGHIII